MPQRAYTPDGVPDELATCIDRRLLTRYPCTHAPVVTLLLRPGLQRYKAIVRDVSVEGIGLVFDMPLQRGTQLGINLSTGRQSGLPGILSATVRHATELEDETWLVGCSLSRSLTDDEMHFLILSRARE